MYVYAYICLNQFIRYDMYEYAYICLIQILFRSEILNIAAETVVKSIDEECHQYLLRSMCLAEWISIAREEAPVLENELPSAERRCRTKLIFICFISII